jgi:heme-degrading monooxygenase HmoA
MCASPDGRMIVMADPRQTGAVMYARVNRFQDRPENLDEAERFAEGKIIPQLQTLPGFLGVLSLVDRTTGGSLAITFWESEQAMKASEAEASRLRGDVSQGMGSEIRTVERYEVTLRVGI